MHRKIRLLVVDDSAFMRKIIKQLVESDPGIEVVGSARDGAEGLEKAISLVPDVITMDVEMPRMNGLEATEAILERLPIPIIMVSSLTSEGAKATFDALDRGALDYVSKNLVSSALDMMKVQDELVSKIKAVAVSGKRLLRMRSPTPAHASYVPAHHAAPPPARPAQKGFVTQKVAFVAIGASTGGPRAIQEVLTHLSSDITTPFLVTVHMPGAFTGAFAERLNGLCSFSVKEITDGERIRNGHVYLSPGGVQTRVRRRGLSDYYFELNDTPFDTLYKPCVDIAMTSVADVYHGRCLGVILTGMGHDGLEGMRLIKARGGKTMTQTEETCTVYGMPKAIVDAGIADKIVPLDHVAPEILNMI
ncbi:MAG: chemotaxis response regulator protein-glutamate methylesterase [Thermodesulfobacteriota bacterium]